MNKIDTSHYKLEYLKKIYRLVISFIICMIFVVILIGSYFLVPDKWILDYKTITVKDGCTSDLHLDASSERYPKITTSASGEDNLYQYPLRGQLPLYRFEWSGATYRKGTTGDSWTIGLYETLEAGEYVIVGEPKVKFLFLERPIGPIEGEPFTISDSNCKHDE